MIIMQINAGLGNQMSKYALGRHLAILNGTRLKLDISLFKPNAARKYGLHHFNIQADVATPQEINKLKTSSLSKKFGWFKRSHVGEREPNIFDENILKLKGDFYLEGYWGTEKYFKDIEPVIRNDFKVKYELAGKNKEVADRIANVNAISVHVRRGDYLDDPESRITFGLEYYKNAAEYLAQRVDNPHFFIFSDDMPWVKNNLFFNSPACYVDHNNDDTNYEDLRLMSLCRHAIVANSSFSWWGAWLSEYPDKIIVVPKKLFNDPNLSEKDCIPESWIRM